MVFETFRKMREECPQSAAFLVTSGDRALPISWRQFTDDIDLVVSLIMVHAPGSRIALLGENSYEWLVCHAAIVFSGATVIPLDIDLPADEIADRLKFVGAVALIYSSLHEAKARDVARQVPGLTAAAFGSIRTERFLDKVRRAFRHSDSVWNGDTKFDLQATSMIMFTSGTTSSPRGAELTVAGVEAFIRHGYRGAEGNKNPGGLRRPGPMHRLPRTQPDSFNRIHSKRATISCRRRHLHPPRPAGRPQRPCTHRH